MHVYVATPPDEDGYPLVEVEELHGEEEGPGLVRLTGVPVFAYGIARGDLFQVEVRRGDDRPWIVAVVESSDHWTTRVVSLVGEDLGRIAQELDALGCDAVETPYGLVAIDVPPEVAQDQVLGLLERGRDSGRWDFDLGVDPRESS